MTVGSMEQGRTMILRDRSITIRGIASTVDISEGSAHSVAPDILGFHKVCVLKELTKEHKHNCVGISSHLNKWYHNEGDSF